MSRSERRHILERIAIRNWRVYRATHPHWVYYCRYVYRPHVDPYYQGKVNPPSSYRHMWRRQLRVRNKRAFQMCEDWDVLQQFPIQKLTSIYDWY